MLKFSRFLNNYKPLILLIISVVLFFIPWINRISYSGQISSICDYIMLLKEHNQYSNLYNMPATDGIASYDKLMFFTYFPTALAFLNLTIFILAVVLYFTKKINLSFAPSITFVVSGLIYYAIVKLSNHSGIYLFLVNVSISNYFYLGICFIPCVFIVYTLLQLYCYSRLSHYSNNTTPKSPKLSNKQRIAELEKQVAELRDSQKDKS